MQIDVKYLFEQIGRLQVEKDLLAGQVQSLQAEVAALKAKPEPKAKT